MFHVTERAEGGVAVWGWYGKQKNRIRLLGN